MKRKKKPVREGHNLCTVLSVVLMSFVLILALLGLLYHQFQKAFLSSINRANEEFVFQVSATSSSTEEFLQNMVKSDFLQATPWSSCAPTRSLPAGRWWTACRS